MQLPSRADRAAVAHALDAAGAAGLSHQQMSEISGGQFQRVLLARALLAKPNVLLLDEPTQGLDQSGAVMFYRQIEQVRGCDGCAVLLVSHELQMVMSASDRVICLNGHICCQGRPEQVAATPDYQALFETGTAGALALYRHNHDYNPARPTPTTRYDGHAAA
jgi:zinc transport system ATP-binding protein